MDFKDSCISGCEKTFSNFKHLKSFLNAVDELKSSKLDFISKTAHKKDDVNIIDYAYVSEKSAVFYTFYYVGFYSN